MTRRASMGALALACALGVAGPAAALPVLPGDWARDGSVDVTDVQCGVVDLADPGSTPPCLTETAEDSDLNCDGARNVTDLQLLVLLAVGNPLSAATDLDGDGRVDACDPDRDGDGWSDACEALAGTDAASAGSAPASAAACPGAALTTACRVTGAAGTPFRCDVLVARAAGTVAASGLEVVVQVDPAAATLTRLDTTRTCSPSCAYGAPAPPAAALPGGQALALTPACAGAPCGATWDDGKLGVAAAPAPGASLSAAVWTDDAAAPTGDAFVLSVVGTLQAAASALPVEILAPAAALGDGTDAPVSLRRAGNAAVLVTSGPPEAGDECVVAADCDDDNPCTAEACDAGFCAWDEVGGPCDDGDPCTGPDTCFGGVCTSSPLPCDDGLACTADTCAAGSCVATLQPGSCLVGGACESAGSPFCAPVLTLAEVGIDAFPAGDDLLEIAQGGSATVLLDDVEIIANGFVFTPAGVTLAPGQRLVVHTGPGTDAGLEVFAGAALGDLTWAGGDVALAVGGALVDYVAWGAGPWPSRAAAVAAGLWPDGERLEVGALGAGDSLQSETAGAGPGSWDGAAATPGVPAAGCGTTACVEVACVDGVDNDLEGGADCDDADCAGPDCPVIEPELCGDGLDNDDDGLSDCADPDCAAAAGCSSAPRLGEVRVVPGGDTWIEVANDGNAPVAYTRLNVCLPGGCGVVPGPGFLGPGAYLLVHTGAGSPTFQDAWLSGVAGGLDPALGEVLLLDADASAGLVVHDYVRWGEGTGQWEGEAVTAGQWPSGATIFAGSWQPGDSLAWSGAAAEGPAAWDVHAVPSPAAANPPCTAPGQCRESRCGDAADDDADGDADCLDTDCEAFPACTPRVALLEVIPDGPAGDQVELVNLGAGTADLSGWVLEHAGTSAFTVPDGTTLAPQALLLLHAAPGTDDGANLHGLPFDLAAAGGELALARGAPVTSANLVDYVRWGNGTVAREPAALVAGQWLGGTSVDTAGLVPGSDGISYDGLGDTAADWSVRPATPGALHPLELADCDDDVDNDGDGLTDCADPDCAPDAVCGGEICGNGLDDDADGDADCADADCAGLPACVEAGKCSDGVDNDVDGLTDCADAVDCAAAPECDEAAACKDGADNDGDGDTDCADADCASTPACALEIASCADGLDNDGDGKTDCADAADCAGDPVCVEAPDNCLDGADNDLDGATDCDDTQCAGLALCTETACTGGVDDDLDGDTDCDDLDCATLPVCTGTAGVPVLNELILDGPGGSDRIELLNVGTSTAVLDGWRLCVGASCYAFPAGTQIDPLGFLRVDAGNGLDGGGLLFAKGALGTPSSVAGDCTLASGVPVTSPARVIDYVQWGAAGGPGEAAAVAAGEWSAGAFVPSAAYTPGTASYIWLGTGDGVAHWALSFAPSPGLPNPSCASPGQCAELACSGGQDEDGDGATDCADVDCADVTACLAEAGNCEDGLDNDGDGTTDCADADCASLPDCDEALACFDGVDNDLDGATDCADGDCSGAGACAEAGNCDDGQDNDADGLVDCDDDACDGDPACGERVAWCDDAADNDGDGLTDCADPDCAAAGACQEAARCADGRDDDGDGLTDCADPDCAGRPACAPGLRLSEVALSVQSQAVLEVANRGAAPFDAGGWWACASASCWRLPSPFVVPAGGTHAFFEGTGGSDASTTYLDTPFGWSPGGGSAALYARTVQGAPAGLADFVQWGAVGQPREAEAVARKLWPAGVAVPTAGLPATGALARFGVTREPRDWTVRTADTVGALQGPCGAGCKETWCDDRLDDDRSGAADCADAACAGDAACVEAGRCADRRDNDLDGATDCWDPGCATDAACAKAARLSEILPTAAGDDRVELVNALGLTLSLGGARLCTSATACFALPGGTSLAPGGRLVVHGGAGASTATNLYAAGALGDLAPAGGLVALTDGGAPTDPAALLDFVGWGLQGGPVQEAAVAAGLWAWGDTIPTAALASNDALATSAAAPGRASWRLVTVQTPGGGNPTCATPGACRETICGGGADEDGDGAADCDDPDCGGVGACGADVVLNEVVLDDPDRAGVADAVELRNRGAAEQALGGWRLCTGPTGTTCWSFPGGAVLAPGGHLAVVLAAGTDAAPLLYAGGALGDLASAAGHVSLHAGVDTADPALLVDYVAWGVSAQAGAALASAAGAWPSDGAVPMAAWRANRRSLARVAATPGPDGWALVATATPGAQNPACNPTSGCEEAACANGLDDDNDGEVDCDDPSCAGTPACGEAFACDDGEDDDGDGLADCRDYECRDDAACQEGLACADGRDNDQDGALDCADGECAAKTLCREGLACADGVDQDLDGATDCADPDCAGRPACPESASCFDGVDNDVDTLVDCLDPSCAADPGCDEGLACQDGLDNDLDGLTDCADADCAAVAPCAGGAACAETDAVACGQSSAGVVTGAFAEFDYAACGFDAAGPAAVVRLAAACDGTATLTLSGAAGDDRLLTVLQGACSTEAPCQVYEPSGPVTAATAAVAAGLDTFVLVSVAPDGTGDASYLLETACTPCAEAACADGLDEDLDGAADCADPDCAADAACLEALACDNGDDDDGDGLADCEDPDCAAVEGCAEAQACGDLADNDLDGLVDCADPDCPHYVTGASDGICEASEDPVATGSPATCGDGVDNDADGLTDCADPDCEGLGPCP